MVRCAHINEELVTETEGLERWPLCQFLVIIMHWAAKILYISVICQGSKQWLSGIFQLF